MIWLADSKDLEQTARRHICTWCGFYIIIHYAHFNIRTSAIPVMKTDSSEMSPKTFSLTVFVFLFCN